MGETNLRTQMAVGNPKNEAWLMEASRPSAVHMVVTHFDPYPSNCLICCTFPWFERESISLDNNWLAPGYGEHSASISFLHRLSRS